jgi:mannose-1-phosphate guanylyltransferase
MIRHVLDRLPEDVDKVVLAVNYRTDQLEDYFDRADVGREVVLVEEKEPLGTGGAIKNVEAEIDGPFFVFNGDIVDDLDLAAFRSFHESTGALASIALHRVPDPRAYGVVALEGPRITRFVEKPARLEDAPSDLVNAGTYLLQPEAFDAMIPKQVLSVERDVFPKLIAEGKLLGGFAFDGYWIDCGKPETYLKANEIVLRERGLARLLDMSVEDYGAESEEWAVVGARARIGERASVERSVLLPGVVVGRGATVKHTILGEDAVVEDDAAVVDCVVGDRAVGSKGVVLRNAKVEPGAVVGEAER